MARTRRVTVRREQTCPLCREILWETPDLDLAVCARCSTVSHLHCLDELGKGACSTAGCAKSARRAARVPLRAEEAADPDPSFRELTIYESTHWVTRLAVITLVASPWHLGMLILAVLSLEAGRWGMAAFGALGLGAAVWATWAIATRRA